MTKDTTQPMEEQLDEILAILTSLVGKEYSTMNNDPVILLKYKAEAKAELTNLIAIRETEAAIMGAKFGNAAFRQYNISNPGKPINLDETLRIGIEQAIEWVESKTLNPNPDRKKLDV